MVTRFFCILWLAYPTFSQVAQDISDTLMAGQLDLADAGRTFLLTEASNSQFFLLGELHGENEVPSLIRSMWPSMWKSGYRHVVAELSPWTANRLEFGGTDLNLVSLWTRPEAAFVAGFRRSNARDAVLWGCDMEELRPDLLIADLAAANPKNSALLAAVSLSKAGYERKMAPELVRLIRTAVGIEDVSVGGRSLLKSILESLNIEVLRLSPDRLTASEQRESLMKEIFYERWQANAKPRVLLRFGRNHLHRGYDRRGVSTLGNFVAELAFAHRLKAFNVAVFAGGGKVRLAGRLGDWDERADDPAFSYLSSLARHPATVFDLRPLRHALHRIPERKRSPTESSLIYWADSYDAILYYREVTPIEN